MTFTKMLRDICEVGGAPFFALVSSEFLFPRAGGSLQRRIIVGCPFVFPIAP